MTLRLSDVQLFRFGPVLAKKASIARHQIGFFFPAPMTVRASIALDVISTGFDPDRFKAGVVYAGVRTVEVQDLAGRAELQESVQLTGATVAEERCTAVIFELLLRFANGSANGVVFARPYESPFGPRSIRRSGAQRRAVFFDPQGEIVGSWTSIGESEAAQGFIDQRVNELSEALNTDVGVLDDRSTLRLEDLVGRVDPKAHRFVPAALGQRLHG